jgi:hypothetical protein
VRAPRTMWGMVRCVDAAMQNRGAMRMVQKPRMRMIQSSSRLRSWDAFGVYLCCDVPVLRCLLRCRVMSPVLQCVLRCLPDGHVFPVVGGEKPEDGGDGDAAYAYDPGHFSPSPSPLRSWNACDVCTAMSPGGVFFFFSFFGMLVCWEARARGRGGRGQGRGRGCSFWVARLGGL